MIAILLPTTEAATMEMMVAAAVVVIAATFYVVSRNLVFCYWFAIKCVLIAVIIVTVSLRLSLFPASLFSLYFCVFLYCSNVLFLDLHSFISIMNEICLCSRLRLCIRCETAAPESNKNTIKICCTKCLQHI